MTSSEDGPTERCFSCGADLPRLDGPVHRYMTSAPSCWAAYGELCAHLLSDPAAAGYRQLCADTYAVQHPGQPGPQAIQSVGGHLVSLHAQLDLGLPVSRSSVLLEAGIRMKGYFSWLTPPSFEGGRSVRFMLDHLQRAEPAAREWALSAWNAWREHHPQVRTWFEDLTKRVDRA